MSKLLGKNMIIEFDSNRIGKSKIFESSFFVELLCNATDGLTSDANERRCFSLARCVLLGARYLVTLRGRYLCHLLPCTTCRHPRYDATLCRFDVRAITASSFAYSPSNEPMATFTHQPPLTLALPVARAKLAHFLCQNSRW